MSNSTAEQIAQTAIQTAEAAAPALLAAGVGVAAASNPTVAAVTQVAPIALQFIQSAIQLQNAGVMTDAQLAEIFQTVGNGIKQTHDAWAAMNANKA